MKKKNKYELLIVLKDLKKNKFSNNLSILHSEKNKLDRINTELNDMMNSSSFKEGEIIINTQKISDKSFNRTIAKLISKWTGRIWQVHSSTSNIGKSLNEEDIINQQKEIELMKNNNLVKKILIEFPESSIHSITELTDVNTNEDIINSKIKKEQ